MALPAPSLSSVDELPHVISEQEVRGGCRASFFEFKRKRASRGWIAVLVSALLFFYGWMAFSGSLDKGVSFDESLQLAMGYNIWLNHDFRSEGANGDLIKRWATLPFLLSRPKFVDADDPAWLRCVAYHLGWKFLFEVGNRPEALLRQSRIMITILGMILGGLVFWVSHELWGRLGAFLSITLFVFSPCMLAFGGIVSTDMSSALTLFASTWCIWRVLHKISIGRLCASVVSICLLVLAKATALVIIPIAFVMLATKLAVRNQLLVSYRGFVLEIISRRRQLIILTALAFVHVFAAWAAIWAHYEFRYSANPQPDNPAVQFFKMPSRDEVPPVLTSLVAGLRRSHFLPEGFIIGIQLLLRCDDHLAAFMNGNWRLGGWIAFFPYAIWVKTPPALFLLIGVAAIGWMRLAGGYARREFFRRLIYPATPHFSLIFCYLAVAMTEDLNIGHRHVLPLYPSLYVLAGSAVLTCKAWPRIASGIVMGALAWLIADSWAVRPHYLSYFGPQAGGPANGYKHLVDSSLEWGMDLPALKSWLREHNPGDREPVFLSYFGNDNPDYYGIKAKRLPGYFEHRYYEPYALTAGYYVISASIFQGVHTAAFGPWSKYYERFYRAIGDECRIFSQATPGQRQELLREHSFVDWLNHFTKFENLRLARLCAWLRHRGEPQFVIANSLFIWKLDAAALSAAIDGAPIELTDRPGQYRQFQEFVPTTK